MKLNNHSVGLRIILLSTLAAGWWSYVDAKHDMEKAVTNICNKVGYSRPENIKSFSSIEDVNGDGIPDIKLILNDGSKLEYTSKLEYISKQ